LTLASAPDYTIGSWAHSGALQRDMSDSPIQTVPPPSFEAGQSADLVREQDKLMLVLAYLPLLFLIPFVAVKDSDYVKWHAKQGLALSLTWVAYGVVVFAFGRLSWLLYIVSCTGHLTLLILVILAIIKAFEPARWRIPVISSLAEKF